MISVVHGIVFPMTIELNFFVVLYYDFVIRLIKKRK